MRVLVCGSREWTDERAIDVVLSGCEWVAIDNDSGICVIEGQCPVGHGGADRLAERWAKAHQVGHAPFPGETCNGRFQGPERNQRMLDEGKPDLVVAFKDGFQRDPTMILTQTHGGKVVDTNLPRGGTEDMVRRAKAAGIPVYIVSHG